MKFQVTCNYCDYKWDYKFVKCLKCGDTNIKVKEINDNSKIDYYKGSPAFVPKRNEEDYGF